jgi:peptidoglycan hydrolase CwlO-like protein
MENKHLEREADKAKDITTDVIDKLIAEIEELEKQVELSDLRIGEMEDELEQKDNYIDELKQRLNDYDI